VRAAALACLNLLVKLGLPRKNIFVTDLAGVVYKGRVELMDPDKDEFAQDTAAPYTGRGDSPAPTCSWACRPAAC